MHKALTQVRRCAYEVRDVLRTTEIEGFEACAAEGFVCVPALPPGFQPEGENVHSSKCEQTQ